MDNPKHIAIIMDGNGRWAKQKMLPKNLGHRYGAKAAEKIIKACKELNIKYLTLYAFSSENWQRPKAEVNNLMMLLKSYLKDNISKILSNGVKILFIGDHSELDIEIQNLMQDAIEKSTNNSDLTLILAISYGGRNEIRHAAFEMLKYAISNNFDKESLKQLPNNFFDRFMVMNNIPDPDLLIRTGGEHRISNFLLWQLAYTELYFTDKLWPDFDEIDLKLAIKNFANRERRYGK